MQYFRRAGGQGQVIAADCSELAPALYDADEYFIVPRIDDANYLSTILNTCEENQVSAVLSLIDPELSIIAQNRQAFLDVGTMPIVSDHAVIEMSLDKYAMYQFLVSNGFNAARSYIDKEAFYADVDPGQVKYPAFVKTLSRSAGIRITKLAQGEKRVKFYFRNDGLMIQEYMDGTSMALMFMLIYCLVGSCHL